MPDFRLFFLFWNSDTYYTDFGAKTVSGATVAFFSPRREVGSGFGHNRVAGKFVLYEWYTPTTSLCGQIMRRPP